MAAAIRRMSVADFFATRRFLDYSFAVDPDFRGEREPASAFEEYCNELRLSMTYGVERLAIKGDLAEHELAVFNALAKSTDPSDRMSVCMPMHDLMEGYPAFAYPHMKNLVRDYHEEVRRFAYLPIDGNIPVGAEKEELYQRQPDPGFSLAQMQELRTLHLAANAGRNLYYPGREDEAFARFIGGVTGVQPPSS